MEARIGAEVYDEKMLLDEFLYGSGDTHAAYAKVVFADELKDINVELNLCNGLEPFYGHPERHN